MEEHQSSLSGPNTAGSREKIGAPPSPLWTRLCWNLNIITTSLIKLMMGRFTREGRGTTRGLYINLLIRPLVVPLPSLLSP